MKKVLFSAAERAHVARLVVGKPSGVTVDLGGVTIDLLPLTNDQGDEMLRLVGVISELSVLKDTNGADTFGVDMLLALIQREGSAVKGFVRDVLFAALDAAGAIDHANDGDAVFAEWYGQLELIETIKVVGPKIIAASGLTTMLGNPSTAGAKTIAPAPLDQPLPGVKTSTSSKESTERSELTTD